MIDAAHAELEGWTLAPAASGGAAAPQMLPQPQPQSQPLPGEDAATGVLNIDLHQRSVSVGGRSVALTAKEYLLIELLFTSRGRLFGRDDILERIWGLDFFGDARIVDVYVKRLRSKLGAAAIETVRGLGYRCPLPETTGVAQPHLQRLPPEARLLTKLAQRILQVTDPGHIIADVYELLREHYGVQGVTLWARPSSLLLAHAGPLRLPGSSPDLLLASPKEGGRDVTLVPLGTGTAGEGPWALLAFWGNGQEGWTLEVRSALDAVAGLVNPALRLNSEITRREQAEREVRTLNLELEGRVQTRTQALARANGDLQALYDLAQQLAGASSLDEVLASGLSVLAAMGGATVCSLWRLQSTDLTCLGAYSPGHHDRRIELQDQAASLASLLRQSVACTSGVNALTRTAVLPDGRQVLLIPVASGLTEVHALHLELPGEVPTDLSLLDAAARAFGLAFERQVQTLMIEQAALSDELTGLPNRRALLADLTAELSYSQRHRTSLTLSLFEIPDIRDVNQRLGFAGGNDLIRSLVGELRGTLRLEDRMYRLGGAVLASLVRSVDAHEGQALVTRLNALPGRFGAAGDGRAAAPGDGLLQISHASAPDETVELSDLLHLALNRLGPPARPQDNTGFARGSADSLPDSLADGSENGSEAANESAPRSGDTLNGQGGGSGSMLGDSLTADPNFIPAPTPDRLSFPDGLSSAPAPGTPAPSTSGPDASSASSGAGTSNGTTVHGEIDGRPPGDQQE